MQFRTLIATCLLGASAVSASVIVITNQPVPTIPSSMDQDEIRDHNSEFISRISDWIVDNGGTSFAAEVTSAVGEMNDFVATATYDIPPIVTDLFAETTYTTEPEWWSAVPTDVREVYDQIATAGVSILSEMYADAAPTEAARAKAGLGAGFALAAAGAAAFL